MNRLVYSAAAALCLLGLATSWGFPQTPSGRPVRPKTPVAPPKKAGSQRPPQVGKVARLALTPPNFNLQVSFNRDYQVRKTPPGFTTGISAFTQASVSYQGDGRGGVTVTLDVDRSASWVLDWVFNPRSIGQTQTDVANLLAHEQVHFDLSALAVREFLNLAQGQSNAQQQQLWASFYGAGGRVQALDNLYESSTRLGLNLATQAQWVQQIASLKSRPDGTFTQLEQWAQRFRNSSVRPAPPRPRR